MSEIIGAVAVIKKHRKKADEYPHTLCKLCKNLLFTGYMCFLVIQAAASKYHYELAVFILDRQAH